MDAEALPITSFMKKVLTIVFLSATIVFSSRLDSLDMPSLGVGYNTSLNEDLFIEIGPVIQSDYKDFHFLCSFMGLSMSNYYGGSSTVNDSLQTVGGRESGIRLDLQFTYTFKVFRFLSVIPGMSFAYDHFETDNLQRDSNSGQTSWVPDYVNEGRYSLFPDGTDRRFELSAKIAFWNAFYYRINYGFATKAPINQGIGYFMQSDRAFGFIEFAMISPHVINNHEAIGYFKSGFGYYIRKNDCPNYWRLKNNPGLVGRILPIVLPGAVISIAITCGVLIALALGSHVP